MRVAGIGCSCVFWQDIAETQSCDGVGVWQRCGRGAAEVWQRCGRCKLRHIVFCSTQAGLAITSGGRLPLGDACVLNTAWREAAKLFSS